MELRHLRYFVAIAEERSFTRAAERLWIAQPGLSTQIRRLERELGVQLFERHTRGVDLTNAGELFLERARAALAAADVASSTGSDIESGILGSVRLGLSSAPRWQGAVELLDAFAHARPAVEVSVLESYGGALGRDLRDGRLDAMIVPSIFASPEFCGVALGSEPWTVLVGANHKLAGEGALSVDALQGEEFIVTGHRDGSAYDRAVADTLSGLGLNTVLRSGGPGPALLADVASGEALALGTVACAADFNINARPLEPPDTLGFELLWNTDVPTPALAELIRIAEHREPRVTPAARPVLKAVA
jgi:DNA-binding transcriptional LysR family regulator